jgi:hypothetical protein
VPVLRTLGLLALALITVCIAHASQLVLSRLALLEDSGTDISQQRCDQSQITALRQALSIPANAKLRASVCKAMPDQAPRLLVAIAYEPFDYKTNNQWELPIQIAIVDGNTHKLVASTKRSFTEDAALSIGMDSLWLDTARYQLSKELRAFGLRISAENSASCADGGSDNELTLFVQEQRQLRAVLGPLTMRRFYHDVEPCSPQVMSVDAGSSPASTSWQLTIEVQRKHYAGFADLVLVERRSNAPADSAALTVERRVRLRYDGSNYQERSVLK